ncbi:MAG: Crp/Fnr family transcriptional regulator [Flavobacteriales bacterium]|jgi:CRP-like cAMP-binding protein|nr:Crp/Fnr family transcriptional regulator [Flavobacteriales bacterium]
MKNELEEYIKSYFGVVEEEEVCVISSFFKLKKVNKGEFYLKEGQLSNALSFVQDGLMRVYVDEEDREVTQWISSKGYFITDLSSFIFRSGSRWNIQALVDSEIYSITAEDYQKLGTVIPKWHLLEKLFIVRCFGMMEDRIYTHLSMTAEERYHFFFEKNKMLFNQVPLKYIASMLGMTPETFSRIRKKQRS